MVIFRYEWKRRIKSILIWASVLAVCIATLTPVYVNMVGSAGALPDFYSDNRFLGALGMSMELLQTPLGMYGFLTNFLMNAGGVFALHLGMSLFVSECTNMTAEYIYTKPCGRTGVFLGKTACMTAGVLLVAIFYLISSLLTIGIYFPEYVRGDFVLIALSFGLHALVYGMLGIFLGARFQKNRSPILTAELIVFSGYGISAFSRTIDNHLLTFFSPFSFFEPALIHANGFYEFDYLIWYVLLIIVFPIFAHRSLLKQDISMVV